MKQNIAIRKDVPVVAILFFFTPIITMLSLLAGLAQAEVPGGPGLLSALNA